MNLTSLKLIANTTWSWTETVCNKIVFFKDSANKFTLTGTGSTSPYTFSHPEQDINCGIYKYQAFLNDDLILEGKKLIRPNLETDENPRTDNEIILDNYKTARRELSSQTAKEITLFDGTHVTYADLKDLEKMIGIYEKKVDIENGVSRPTVYRSKYTVGQ